MRQSIAAVALIRREHEGQTLWLAQWNPAWQRYNFASGHKHEDESFRQCMIRELGEELGLRDGSDFRVADKPTAHVEYVAWSESAQADTQYTMELFDVELLGEAARQKIDADPKNRWLSEVEIRSQQCDDGQPVSATMQVLLSRIGAKRPEAL